MEGRSDCKRGTFQKGKVCLLQCTMGLLCLNQSLVLCAVKLVNFHKREIFIWIFFVFWLWESEFSFYTLFKMGTHISLKRTRFLTTCQYPTRLPIAMIHYDQDAKCTIECVTEENKVRSLASPPSTTFCALDTIKALYDS